MRKAGSGLIIKPAAGLSVGYRRPFSGPTPPPSMRWKATRKPMRYEVAPFGADVAIVEPGPFGTGLLAFGQTTRPRRRARLLWRTGWSADRESGRCNLPRCCRAKAPPTGSGSVDADLTLAEMPATARGPDAHGCRHNLGRR
jgi:hypothetical protein